MTRSFAITLAALLALATAPAPAAKAPMRGLGHYTIPAWFKSSFLDLREDAAEAAGAGKRLLVYFGQDRCPYCAELFNNNFSQRHIVEYTRKHFEALDINMWGDREVTDFDGEVLSEKQLAAKHKVWFTPTILFFDGQGRRLLRINGYYPPHKFLAALRFVAEASGGTLAFPEFLARESPPPATGRLNAQPFFAAPPHDLASVRERPVAVFFEQRDCEGCDRLHREVLAAPETRAQLERFHAIQLDRWGDTPVVTPAGERTAARAWADQLGIAYVPTAVLFDRGREVVRIEAFFKAFHVQSVLDYCASGAYRREPSLQRFLQQRADALRERGIVVDLWR